jgi:hypothetical protein
MPVKITVDDSKLRELIANTGAIATAVIADGVSYGIYQELGTSKMPAHEFMKPAVEAVRPGFEKAFMGQLTNAQIVVTVKKIAFEIEDIAKKRAPVRYGNLRNSIHVVQGGDHSFEWSNE